MKLFLAFFFLAIVFFPTKAFAETSVVINEFAAITAGTSADPDWVELYNPSDSAINLDGWTIRDSSATNKIPLTGSICPDDFRKFPFGDSLNKAGDNIKLFDAAGNLVDSVVYFSETVPTHSQGESTGREPDGENNWQKFTTPTPLDHPCEAASQNEPTPQPTIVYLNEFMPNPETGDEWVEIYNPNKADLSGWKLTDSSTNSKTLKDATTNSEGFLVVYLSGWLNNSGDTLNLLKDDGAVAESYTFGTATKGVSFAKDASGAWQETTTPTLGSTNVITKPSTQTSQPNNTTEKKETTNVSNTGTNKNTQLSTKTTPKILGEKTRIATPEAKISTPSSPSTLETLTQDQRPKNFFSPIFIGLGIVFIVSAAITLFKRVKK